MKEEMQNIKSELDEIKSKIEHNFNNINKNRDNINENTGAVALLHTLNSNSNKYFIIWIITFVAFLCSIGYIVYLKTEYSSVETIEEIQQENTDGNNILWWWKHGTKIYDSKWDIISIIYGRTWKHRQYV